MYAHSHDKQVCADMAAESMHVCIQTVELSDCDTGSQHLTTWRELKHGALLPDATLNQTSDLLVSGHVLQERVERDTLATNLARHLSTIQCKLQRDEASIRPSCCLNTAFLSCNTMPTSHSHISAIKCIKAAETITTSGSS